MDVGGEEALHFLFFYLAVVTCFLPPIPPLTEATKPETGDKKCEGVGSGLDTKAPCRVHLLHVRRRLRKKSFCAWEVDTASFGSKCLGVYMYLQGAAKRSGVRADAFWNGFFLPFLRAKRHDSILENKFDFGETKSGK